MIAPSVNYIDVSCMFPDVHPCIHATFRWTIFQIKVAGDMLFQDHKFDISQVIKYFKTKVFDHFYYFTKNRKLIKTSATDLRIQEDSLCRYVYMLAKFICLVMSCDEV